MKIVFVENKHKTKFWERIAEGLILDGHEIFWIVQNKLFRPRIGVINVIPLPNKNNLESNSRFLDLEKKDRYCYIYKNNPSHYEYYYRNINDFLKCVAPDIVFGESTLFHELLTIKSCKENKFLYLNPSTCRYPNGRFSFYKYDTQIPYLGSDEKWPTQHLLDTIQKITNKNKQPDYMEKPSQVKLVGYIARRIKSYIFSFMSSNINGEIYNTPLLQQKRKIEKYKKISFKKIKTISISSIEEFNAENTLVFPLQMQPESNIDVWGYPHNSQNMLIERLSVELGENWNILVKLNPKIKYEVSDGLVSKINQLKNVYVLSPDFEMKPIFEKFRFFFSVTGTINHESLLAGKRCFSPSLPITSIFAPKRATIPHKDMLENDQDVDSKVPLKLMKYLIGKSYPGIIGDEIHSPQAFFNDNINKVLKAFQQVLRETKL